MWNDVPVVEKLKGTALFARKVIEILEMLASGRIVIIEPEGLVTICADKKQAIKYLSRRKKR